MGEETCQECERRVVHSGEQMNGVTLALSLRSTRFHGTTEKQLQDAIEAILVRAGASFEREAHLGECGRVDFLLADGTAVEVKTGGSSSDFIRQVSRYAESPRVAVILGVTTQAVHDLPAEVNEKTVALIRIQRRIG